MYTVIGAVRSRAFRVMWTLEELGQEYDHVPAAPGSAEAREFSPLGKIPAFKDGDAVLMDSVAIMTYLADKHGALTFPAGTIDRAIQDAHIHFINEYFDAPLWIAARHTFVLPEDRRIAQVKDAVVADMPQAVERLAERLEGPFLQGDTMTIADILAVHCLNWAFGTGYPVENTEVKEYAKRLRNRDGFKAASAR